MKEFYLFQTEGNPKIQEVGGKAMSLIISTRNELPVPKGFVLTTAFFEPWFNEVKQRKEWKGLSVDGIGAKAETFKEIKAFCRTLKFSQQQQEWLQAAFDRLGKVANTLLAVRSSSPEEDMEGASFAGGYETILGVSREHIEDAVLRCFTSCLDERVHVYKKAHGFDVTSPKIAVIIQEQIASDSAGVGFSLNPLNNAYDEVVINANYGLGESVVSGSVTPDTFVVDCVSNRILFKKPGKKERTVWLNKAGATTEKKTKGSSTYSISDSQVLKVSNLVKRTETYYQKPIDIEWAYQNGELFLLQARPITTHIELPKEMLTQPGEKKRLYIDILIAKQGIQSLFSKMGLDFMEKSQRYLMQDLMGGEVFGISEGLYFNTGGRAYQDLGNSLKVLGKKTVIGQWATSDVLTKQTIEMLDLSEYIPKKTPKKLKNLKLRAIKNNIKTVKAMLRVYKNAEQQKQEFVAQQQVFLGRLDTILEQDLSPKALSDALLHWYMDILKLTLPANYAVVLGLSKVKQILNKANLIDKLPILERAMPDNITLQMGLDMYELSCEKDITEAVDEKTFFEKLNRGDVSEAFKEKWDMFIQKYGFRCPKELDMATPRPHENLGEFFRQLRSMSENTDEQNNPFFIYRQAVAEREDTYQYVCNVLSQNFGEKTKKKFEDNFRVALLFYGFREIHKYYFVMVTDMMRQSVLKIAKILENEKRISSQEKVFDLSIEQLDEAMKNKAVNIEALANENTAFIGRLMRITNFPRVIDSRGKILFPPRRETKPGEIQGEPISIGVVRGRVKVLNTPDEKPLIKGEILVARATDPGWTPLFINAAGVILEVGGMLQHGALVAREYGKPCIAGIENAVSVFEDGQEVEMDGSSGQIKFVQIKES